MTTLILFSEGPPGEHFWEERLECEKGLLVWGFLAILLKVNTGDGIVEVHALVKAKEMRMSRELSTLASIAWARNEVGRISVEEYMGWLQRCCVLRHGIGAVEKAFLDGFRVQVCWSWKRKSKRKVQICWRTKNYFEAYGRWMDIWVTHSSTLKTTMKREQGDC